MNRLSSLDELGPHDTPPFGVLAQVYSAIGALEELSAGTGDERRDTRERILASALELFGAEGVQRTSMRQIAAAVGIKAPGLYSHFESKEAILTAAMARALRSFLVYVVLPSASDAVPLEGVVRRHVRFQLENSRLARANDILLASESSLSVITPDARAILRHAQRVYFEVVREQVVMLGVDSANPAVVALSVLSVCDGVSTWYRSDGSLSTSDIENQIWVIVRRLVTGTESGSAG